MQWRCRDHRSKTRSKINSKTWLWWWLIDADNSSSLHFLSPFTVLIELTGTASVHSLLVSFDNFPSSFKETLVAFLSTPKHFIIPQQKLIFSRSNFLFFYFILLPAFFLYSKNEGEREKLYAMKKLNVR